MILDKGVLEKRRLKLEAELERAVSELKDMGAERIILIGSLADGTLSPLSDMDLVAVMQVEERFLDRIKMAYQRIKPSVAMDLLIYTPEEFDEMKEKSPFLIHALKKGKLLHAA